jgi:hypothetical protein
MTDPSGTSARTSKKKDCVADSGKWHAGRERVAVDVIKVKSR